MDVEEWYAIQPKNVKTMIKEYMELKHDMHMSMDCQACKELLGAAEAKSTTRLAKKIKGEIKRLEKRVLTSKIDCERVSLHGSLMSMRKMLAWVE